MGKSYPSRSEIRYRPYTFGEVKAINHSGLSIKDRFEHILSGIECTNGLEKMDLTLSDALFIGFQRKRATFQKAEKVEIPHFCHGCKKRTTLVLHENSDLEFADMAAPSLPISVSMHGQKFSFSPMTVRGYLDMVDHVSEVLASGEKCDDSVAFLAAQCISHPFKEAYEAIFNASPEEAEALEMIDKLMDHELKPVSLKCENKNSDGSKCGHVSEIKLDEVDRLVLPFRGFDESEEHVRDRLQFGPESPHKPQGSVRNGVSRRSGLRQSARGISETGG
jgi:hypothetical protein